MLKFINITNANESKKQIEVSDNLILEIFPGEVISINETSDYFKIEILNETDLLLEYENGKTIQLKNFVDLLTPADYTSSSIVESLHARLHFLNYDILNFTDLIELLDASASSSLLVNTAYFDAFDNGEGESSIEEVSLNTRLEYETTDVIGELSSDVSLPILTPINAPILNPSPSPIEDFPDIPAPIEDFPTIPAPIEDFPIIPAPIEDFPWIPEPIEDKEAQKPELTVSIDKRVIITPISWNGIEELEKNIIDAPSQIVVGDLNKNLKCKDGDDQVLITNSANANIDLGDGNNVLDIGSDANKKITSGDGDDVIRIGNSSNAKIEMGDGDNTLEIGNDANKKITSGDGNDSIKIGGSLNDKVELGEGDDLLHIAGDSNGNIDMDEGDDKVKIEGNSNKTIDLGDGNDFLEIDGDVNGKINSGDGDDYIIIHGDVNSSINLGDGNDHIIIDGKINAPIKGGEGDDCIELSEYTYDDYVNNVDGIQDSLEGFEAIKFSDGEIIGDETLFEDGNSSYEYDLNINAYVTDVDSEHLSSIKIDASTLPTGVVLLDKNGNEIPLVDGYYEIPLDENSKEVKETITIISDEPISDEDLKNIKVIATGKEENGGDEEEVIGNPIVNDDEKSDNSNNENLNEDIKRNDNPSETDDTNESNKISSESKNLLNLPFLLEEETILLDIVHEEPILDLAKTNLNYEDIIVSDDDPMSIDMLISKYSNIHDDQDITKNDEVIDKLNTKNQNRDINIDDEMVYINTTTDVDTFLIQEDDMLI